MVLRSPRKLMAIALALVLGVAIMTPGPIGATSEVIIFVTWHPDGTLLAVGNQNTVQILDTATTQVLNVFSDLEMQATAPAWSPDGDRLAIANGSQLDIWQYPWDPDAAELVLSHSSPDWRWLYALAWSPNADKIAVGDVAVLEVWDVFDVPPQLLLYSSEPGDDIKDVVWSPSGTLLANTGLDHTVRVWDVATGDLLSTLIVSNDPVTSFASEIDVTTLDVAWSPDEGYLVFACGDGTVRTWDLTATTEPETISYPYTSNVLYRHEDAVWAVDWSPDGRWIASGGADNTLRVWDVIEGEVVDVIRTGELIGSVAFSPDSARLAYGDITGGVEIRPVSSSPLPDFEPLSACWVRDWNQAQTEWHIDNPNPVPLSTNPEVKVRYNWTAYDAFDAQGSVVQSATGWDNANPNPLNTPLAKSLRLEWYLVIDGQSTEILGETIVNADESGQCPGPPAGSGTGLQGEYFNKKDFTRLALTRIDSTIDFDWGKDAPAPEVQKNSFSVRWSGQVEPRYSETYTFYTVSDDGVRLWVDDQPVIDNWNNHSAREDNGAIALAAGQRY